MPSISHSDSTVRPPRCCGVFNSKCCYIEGILLSRLLMLAQCAVIIYFGVCIAHTDNMITCVVVGLIIIAEAVYLCVWNGGRDFYWFSISYLGYSALFIGVSWRASTGIHLEEASCLLKTNNHSTVNPAFHMCFNIPLDDCQAIYIAMTAYLMTLLFSKLRSPISVKDSKVDHSNLLAVLLAAAADVIDFFEYMFELEVVEVIGLTVLYSIATISLIQFSLNLMAKKRYRRDPRFVWRVINYLFCTESWAILLVLFTIDVPYFVIRVLIVANGHFFVVPTLFFFLLKNLLSIIVAFYRLYAQYIEFKRERELDDFIVKI